MRLKTYAMFGQRHVTATHHRFVGGWNTAVSSNLCGYQNGYQVSMHEMAGRRVLLTTDYPGSLMHADTTQVSRSLTSDLSQVVARANLASKPSKRRLPH